MVLSFLILVFSFLKKPYLSIISIKWCPANGLSWPGRARTEALIMNAKCAIKHCYHSLVYRCSFGNQDHPVDVHVDKDVVLHCWFNTSEVECMWTKNETVLQLSGRFIVSGKRYENGVDCTMIVKGVQHNDTGSYQCSTKVTSTRLRPSDPSAVFVRVMSHSGKYRAGSIFRS